MSFARSYSAQPKRSQRPAAGQRATTDHTIQANRSQPAVRAAAIDPDLELARRVSAYLRDRGVAAASALDIEVRKGTVHIVGRVYSYYEKQLVYHTASRVAGVLQVIADLYVVERDQSESVQPDQAPLAERMPLPSRKVALALGVWLIVAGITIVGRSIGDDARAVKQASLAGRLLVRGVPAAGDYVRLHALDATLDPQPLTARVARDGSFRLSCRTSSRDLPRGFVATVHHAAPAEQLRLAPIPREYTRPESSPLRVRMTTDAENSVTFHIL